MVEAWERVRALVDGAQVEQGDLVQRYGPRVRETASKYFGDLVPGGEKDLFTKLHASVYPCLATYYYCPPSVEKNGASLVCVLAESGECSLASMGEESACCEKCCGRTEGWRERSRTGHWCFAGEACCGDVGRRKRERGKSGVEPAAFVSGQSALQAARERRCLRVFVMPK